MIITASEAGTELVNLRQRIASAIHSTTLRKRIIILPTPFNPTNGGEDILVIRLEVQNEVYVHVVYCAPKDGEIPVNSFDVESDYWSIDDLLLILHQIEYLES